jgi:hypothetical protein
MKKIIALLLCTLPLLATAQEQEYSMGVYELGENKETYIFADTARIRQSPSLQAAVLDSLFAGDALTLLRRTDTITNGSGKKAPWYEVRYEKDGKSRQGYIWGGLLSFRALRRGAVKFVYGIYHISTDSVRDQFDIYTTDNAHVGIKVLKDGKIVARDSYTVGTESLMDTEAGFQDAKGLKQVETVLRTVFSGAACAVPTFTHYHCWNGTQLIALPVITDVSDAGVFYHDETYIFPADKGGQPGKIIFKEITEETADDSPKAKPKVKKSSKVYQWDGKKLVKVGR